VIQRTVKNAFQKVRGVSLLPGVEQSKLQRYGLNGEGEREIVDVDVLKL